MCGIYGVIHPSGDPAKVLERMGRELQHRGPDAAGLVRAGTGWLGHRRLTIIDLSPAGNQPMWSGDESVCIVYNGEVYNFRQLRDECIQSGMSFQSTSDTEVILNQYLMKGERAFSELNGMFAFCLYDRRSGAFYLVRDPTGIKPLYYAPTAHGLFFASELGALTRSGAVAPEIDQEALQAYLQLDCVPAPLCIIQGVRKLVPGEVIRLDPEGNEKDRSVIEIAPLDRFELGSMDENVAEFDRRIHDVVARQLVADVPVGIFLSGGIDSSIIAKTASEVSGSPIATFSIGFREESFDESAYFDEVARVIGSNHHREILDASMMLDLVTTIPRVASEPLADGSIFPTLLLSRFTRGSVKVALSGDGADELFGGYPTHLASSWGSVASRLPASMRRAVSSIAHEVLPVSYDNLSFDFKVKKFLSGLHPDPVIRNMRWLGTFLVGDLPAILPSYSSENQERLEALFHQPSTTSGRGELDAILRTDQRFYMQDDVLVKVDRASMAHSLEVRVPFLDHSIVEFARALPPSQLIEGSHTKRLLRTYAERHFSPTIVQRKKKGFGAPLGHWFRRELRELLQETLSPASIDRFGWFYPDAVNRLVREHLSGEADHRKKLFNLMTFQLWYEDLLRVSTGHD